jgi:hypothetical protein
MLALSCESIGGSNVSWTTLRWSALPKDSARQRLVFWADREYKGLPIYGPFGRFMVRVAEHLVYP